MAKYANAWKVRGVARLTRDAEVKYTNDGSAIIEINVVRDGLTKKEDGSGFEPVFLKASKWVPNGGSVVLAEYLTKGSKVDIEGELNVRKFTTKEGQPATSIEMRVSNIELIDSTRDAATSVVTTPSDNPLGDEPDPFADE